MVGGATPAAIDVRCPRWGRGLAGDARHSAAALSQGGSQGIRNRQGWIDDRREGGGESHGTRGS